jgi:hypothetical protein
VKRSVGKIAVINAGDGKHAQEIETYRHLHRKRTPTHPDNGQTAKMQGDERQATQPIDTVEVTYVGQGRLIEVFRVEPLDKCNGYSAQK